MACEYQERRPYAGTCRASIQSNYGYLDLTGAKVIKLFCGYLFDYYWTFGLATQSEHLISTHWEAKTLGLPNRNGIVMRLCSGLAMNRGHYQAVTLPSIESYAQA